MAGAAQPDVPGTVMLTARLTAVLLPLVEGRQHGWPTWTWLLLAVALVAFGALVAQQRRLHRRGGAPLVDSALLATAPSPPGWRASSRCGAGRRRSSSSSRSSSSRDEGCRRSSRDWSSPSLAAAYVAASVCAPALTERLGRRLVAVGGACLAGGHGLLLAGLPGAGVDGSLGWLVPGLLLLGTAWACASGR